MSKQPADGSERGGTHERVALRFSGARVTLAGRQAARSLMVGLGTSQGREKDGSVQMERFRRSPLSSPSSVNETSLLWTDQRKYTVIVDAGSSGSRLMVYSWRDVGWDRKYRLHHQLPLDVLPTIERGVPPESDQAWQVKVEPGLSSFAGRTGELRPYLEGLLLHVRAVVPEHALPHTPIYVMATAGMRLLEPVERQAILLETCRVLREHPFQFEGSLYDYTDADADSACQGQVRVISGEEEGLFGWIAINYLMNGFSTSDKTFGFLDMGGASTQIAFAPADTSTGADLFNVTLQKLDASKESHHVFVTTFLGYGTNAARTRYLYSLKDGDTTALPDSYVDPCLPKGLQLSLDDGQGHVQGTGSLRQCMAQQVPLLDQGAACSVPPCLFHGVHVPPIEYTKNEFVGVSEYWYSSHDVFDLGGSYDHKKFHQAADEFCASDWSQLEANFKAHKYPSQVTLSRLQMQCFKAAWMSTVLHEGLQLPREHNQSLFQSVNDVHGLGVSWTLGKALLEANKDVTLQAPHWPIPAYAATSWLWLVGFLAVALLGAVALALRRRWDRARVLWMPLATTDSMETPVEEHSMVVPMPQADEDDISDASTPSLEDKRSKAGGAWGRFLSRTASYASLQWEKMAITPPRSASVSASRRSSITRPLPRLGSDRSEAPLRVTSPPMPWTPSWIHRTSSPLTVKIPILPLSDTAPDASTPDALTRSVSPKSDRRPTLSTWSGGGPLSRDNSLVFTTAVSSGYLGSRPPSRVSSPRPLDARRASSPNALTLPLSLSVRSDIRGRPTSTPSPGPGASPILHARTNPLPSPDISSFPEGP